ncbi:Rhodanese-related sulfurtransferase [Solimonas aquatica]|uniref:Rhodanese-related sulfurtransferase n=1 Tax=Solimonas aquatica TaxID=489703 RepID=A0A1H9LL09_9GAMM|nr:rhodanese-like domain-containing protein [Solimonas aquatica]SER11795.1 Rhodanese-related sulfurtransferase [Solimonas aquatica]
MKIISVQELKQQLDAGGLVLLDVRGADEREFASVQPSLHIPLHEIAQRLGELNPQQAIAVLCHHGMRSEMAARFLDKNGFADVANVAGGIDAWSAQVDPSVPRY